MGTSFGAGSAPGNFDVTGYDVTTDYQPGTGIVQGDTVITATATDALDSFTLDLDGPTVRSVTVDSTPVKSFSRDGTKDLVIVPATTVGRGARFVVRVRYDGTPGPGWLATTSGGATAFEGDDSAWFPVHGDTHDRAAFHLTATVPSGWSVVSIGREGPSSHDATTSTFRWTEPDVDPAFVAVSVDRFTIERSALADGTPVVDAYAPGLEVTTKPLADRLPAIIGFLSGLFGPYPFDAAGNVFVDVNSDGPGTAPQTRPVYLGAGNTTYMTIDEVVHEQTHQWYGVSAAPRDQADGCLAECFATYATWLWDAAQDGADLDARYRQQVEANENTASFWQPLHTPGQAPGINMYTKGPLALHALRRLIGDTAFARLLRQWPQEHHDDYVEWPQFEALAERVSGQDLTGFYQAWFSGSTVPPAEYLWPGTLKP